MTKMQELNEQAARAERLASSILDTVTVERLLTFAADCRKQLGVLNESERCVVAIRDPIDAKVTHDNDNH